MTARFIRAAALILLAAVTAALILGMSADSGRGLDAADADYDDETDASGSDKVTLTFGDGFGNFYGPFEADRSELIVLPTTEDLGIEPREGEDVRKWLGSTYPYSEYAVDDVFVPQDDIDEYIFTAIWEDVYHVSFNTHGYTLNPIGDYVHFSLDSVYPPSYPTEVQVLDGYTFDGWYREDTDYLFAPGESFVMPDYDVELHIILKEKTEFTYTYTSLGEAVLEETFPRFEDSSISDQVLQRQHYTHTGWHDTREGKDYAIGEDILAVCDLNLEAKWDPVTYTVTYTDTLFNRVAEVPVVYGTPYEVPGMDASDGMKLLRWERTDDGSRSKHAPGDSRNGDGDMTMDSVWVPEKVTVVFESEHHETEPHRFDGGYVLTLPSHMDTGGVFTLMGWRSGDTEYRLGEQVELLDDMLMEAVWKRTNAMAPEITSDLPASVEASRGEEIVLSVSHADVVGEVTVSWFLDGEPFGNGFVCRLPPDLTWEPGAYHVRAVLTNHDPDAINTESVCNSAVCEVTVADTFYMFVDGVPGPVAEYRAGDPAVEVDMSSVGLPEGTEGLSYTEGGDAEIGCEGTVSVSVSGSGDTVLYPVIAEGVCTLSFPDGSEIDAEPGSSVELPEVPEGCSGWDLGDGFILPPGCHITVDGDMDLSAV